jgi:acyl carrier protein
VNQSEILDNLHSYISKEILDGKDIGLEAATPLLEWGIINSIEIARLVSYISNQFKVEIPSDKITIEYFKDLNAITNLILELKN